MPIGDKIRPVVPGILRELVDAGYEAYIVGGAVRDLLLDLSPKDYDLATSATPTEVREVFGRRRARIIGRRFKIVHVYAKGEIYEVSTFRRQPTEEERCVRSTDNGVMIWRDNEWGTLEEDAMRRDFTVNALYYDPVRGCGLIDFANGKRDLDDRIVRCIGNPDVRFEEDPVRILRALKLVGQFGFVLADEVGAAVERKRDLIQLASSSRLMEEVHKILACNRALGIFEACRKYGFLSVFWPALDRVWDDDVGLLLRKMLAERDRRRECQPDYSTSKALALATICLAYVMKQLNSSDKPGELWEHSAGLEHTCRSALQDFMEPFPLSRYFSSRVRDILLLLPRFLDGAKRGKLIRHPEYKYGRELLSLLVAVNGWDAEQTMARWPDVDLRDNKRSTQGDRSRRGNRSRGRRGGRRAGPRGGTQAQT